MANSGKIEPEEVETRTRLNRAETVLIEPKFCLLKLSIAILNQS
jgi:hypothetical protein